MGLTSDDVALVVLLAARHAYVTDPVLGSVLVMANCGHKAFISPTGRKWVAAHPGAYTYCSVCIPNAGRDEPDRRWMDKEAQMRELRETVGVAEAEQIEAWARHHGFTE